MNGLNNVFYPLLRRLLSGTSQRASSSRTSRISAATQGNSGDGGGGDEDDEKMRQLKERNRMAAHRSREKKKVLKEYRYTITRKGSPGKKVSILGTVCPVGTVETEYCQGRQNSK